MPGDHTRGEEWQGLHVPFMLICQMFELGSMLGILG